MASAYQVPSSMPPPSDRFEGIVSTSFAASSALAASSFAAPPASSNRCGRPSLPGSSVNSTRTPDRRTRGPAGGESSGIGC